MKKYDHKKIEAKWQRYWQAKKIFAAKDFSKKPKKFVLVEFPYPSGAGLHMGHLRPYVAADVYSRFFRMKGFETLFPIGWDAFGLPAENYAIKMGVHPAKTTAQNIKNAKNQLTSWGVSFDWQREINTTDPDYYKWTQWIFLQFFKKGLAYEATGLINWCPKDKTGLANEEVIDGKCERCGTVVEKKELRQWYLKITAYAEKLLEGLKNLPDWPEAVKLQQENWIGKSTGAEIEFEIEAAGGESGGKLKIFTTRPDTLFGATYMVVAPEHEMINSYKDSIENFSEVEAYIRKTKSVSEMDRTSETREKTGVELKGVKAINPANGEKIPVWVADYVLGSYGTGAIMAVPAHDERDWDFAKKYNLAIKQVVAPEIVDADNLPKKGVQIVERQVVHVILEHPTQKKFLAMKWKDYDWLTLVGGGMEKNETPAQGALREIKEETGYLNAELVEEYPFTIKVDFFAAHKKENRQAWVHTLHFKLKDLKQGKIAEAEQKLHEPVWMDFADIKNLKPMAEKEYILGWMNKGSSTITSDGVLVNSGKYSGQANREALEKIGREFGVLKNHYKLRDWVFSRQRYWGEPIPIIHCQDHGAVAVPEKDLPVRLPNVKKYEPTGTGESPLADIASWVKTKCPKCGKLAWRETNTMPQWAGSSWYWLRYADPKNKKNFSDIKKQKYWTPVDIYFGGMEHTTLHLLYSRFWNLFLHDQKLVAHSEPYKLRKPHGIVLGPDGEKMSKSRGNVVNPNDVVKKFGADTLRMYELFLGPHESMVAWNDSGVLGVRRFLDRVWQWAGEVIAGPHAKNFETAKETEETVRKLNKLVKKITEDLEAFRFNTCISSFMEFHNSVKDSYITLESVKIFLKLLSPFAPHFAEELYEAAGGKNGLALQSWPTYDPKNIAESEVEIVVQVNGKVKGKMKVAAGSDEEYVKGKSLEIESVKMQLASRDIRRVIFVKDRLINLVG